MKFLNREKKPVENKTLIPSPKFNSPFSVLGQYYYHCSRCGCVVPEAELKVHSSFHRTQDILLEKLMIYAEKLEQQINETPEG